MKKVLFTLAIGLATLTSCESDSDSNNSNDNDVVLLTKNIDTYNDGSTTTVEYFYEGNKLVRIAASDVFVDTYIYTDGVLTGHEDTYYDLDENDDEVLVIDVSDFEYDSNNRLIKETVTYSEGGITVNTFVHNADGTVTKNYGDGDRTSVYTIINGNLTKIVYTDSDGGESSVTTNTYDTKNQPFKNISNASTFLLLGNYAFTNNQLSVTVTGSASYPEDNEVITYTYNSNDYPVESTTTYASGTVDEETQTTEYFYND